MKTKLLFLTLLCAAFGGSLFAQNSATGNITATSTNCTSVPSSCVWESPLPPNAGTSTVAISGTFTATLLVEESNNGGQTWSTANTLSAAGTTTYSTNGFTDIRVRCSAFTSGSAAVTISTGLLQVQSVVSGGSSSSASSQFSATSFGAVYDDATDNCTAFTNLTTASNAYSGPGKPSVSLAAPSGNSGKAYKTTCNLVFTIPTDVDGGWSTLDCIPSAAFANCIQLGPTGLVNFVNAQSPSYHLYKLNFANGSCVSVTVACIQAPVWVDNPQVEDIFAANVGSASNWFISFDGHNNAPLLTHTVYWNTDATTGRNWSVNNRTGAAGGTNSAVITHNTVVGAGAAPGFTTPCGGAGHTEKGSATQFTNNDVYGFNQPLLLINPAINVMISANQIDQAGCTAGVASADIQYGDGSNGAITGIQIVGSYFSGGAGHAAEAISVANGSSSSISGLTFVGNSVPVGSVKNIFAGATPPSCADCYVAYNPFFAIQLSTSTMRNGVWNVGTSASTQVANIAPATIYSVPANEGAVYRASCYVALTQAATTSSTLPSCSIKFTDFATSVASTTKAAITWASGGAGCSGATTNTLGNNCTGIAEFAAKASTNIQFCTGVTGCDTNGTDYTSVGGTVMQYQVFARVEKVN